MLSAHFPDEDALRESVYQEQAKVEFDALNARLAKSWAENKRYREALEKIANAEEVGYPGSRMGMVEAQSIAMAALSDA